MIVENVAVPAFPISSRENLRLARLLREIVSLSAPILVTRLWTCCTQLKMRELQMQIFH
jgi:hypothetical protein